MHSCGRLTVFPRMVLRVLMTKFALAQSRREQQNQDNGQEHKHHKAHGVK